MTDTNKTSGADVLAFFDDATVVYKSAVTGSQAKHIEGVTVESVIAACGRIKGRLKNVEQARTAVAALIERNAELEADALRTRKMFEQAAKEYAEHRRANESERDALAAEVKALRDALNGCVEHMGWSTPQGKAAFDAARASAATDGGGNE